MPCKPLFVGIGAEELIWGEKAIGGEGGIRTRVGCNSLNRFRVGAVMAASVPLL